MALSLEIVRSRGTYWVIWGVCTFEDERQRDKWTKWKRKALGKRKSFKTKADASKAIREFWSNHA